MNEQLVMSRRGFVLDGTKIAFVVVAVVSGAGTLVIEYIIKKLQSPTFPMPQTLNIGEGIEISGMTILLKDASADIIFGKYADIRIIKNNIQVYGDILRIEEDKQRSNNKMFYDGYTITIEEIVRSKTSTAVKIIVDKT